MTLDPERLERPAKEIKDRIFNVHSVDRHNFSRTLAQQAILAYLGDDVVAAPIEPTQEMLDAALALDDICMGILLPAAPADAYQAMLSASPLAERGKK